MGSKSKARNAISKRRPKHNIIAAILMNAKKHHAKRREEGSGSHTTASSDSTTKRSRSKSKDRSKADPSAEGKDVSRHYHGSKRTILQSAVELTRRSKRSSSRARRKFKKVPFAKGQKAFYRSAKGIAKVSVVGIHHDSKLEPYYTIRLRDGKEKQTDGKHLTPVQEENGKKEKKGKSKERGGKDVVGSVNEMTDPLSESEAEEEVIDYTEEGDDDEEEDPQKGEDKGEDSEADEEEVIDYTDDKGEGEDEKEDIQPRFDVGADAYCRSPDGPVAKVTVISFEDNQYSVTLPDGSQKDGVAPSSLAALTELTSKELSGLMKERNRREKKGRRAHASGKSSADSHGVEDDGAGVPVENNPDKTEGALALLPAFKMTEAKTEDGSTKMVPLYEAGMHVHYQNAAGTSKAEILDVHLDDLLEPYYSIRLEDGREKQTDNAHILFLPGDGHVVAEEGSEGSGSGSKSGEGAESADAKKVEEGGESGTEDVWKEEKREPKEPKQRRRHSMAASTSSNSQDRQERRRSRSSSRDPIGTGSRRRATPSPRDSMRESLTKKLESNEAMRDSLKRMVEEQLQKEELVDPAAVEERLQEQALCPATLTKKHGLEGDVSERTADISDRSGPDVSNRSGPELAHESPEQAESGDEMAKADEEKKAQDPMSASDLNLGSHFALSDEVLYTSSKGQQCQAVVTKLHRDKKNRPYYALRLPDGKEKSVYGHRLRPNVPGNEEEHKKKRSRSRSKGASSRRSSVTGASSRRSSVTSTTSKSRGRSSSKARSSYHRSDSVDSARSSGSEGANTLLSNSSRRSRSRARSSSRRHRSESTRGSTRSERHAPDDIADSHKSRRSRSQSVRRHESSSRRRSTSQAPSEDASLRAGLRSLKSSKSMRSRLKRSVSRPRASTGDGDDWGEDDRTTTKSISKLRSFRKNFASMRKTAHHQQ